MALALGGFAMKAKFKARLRWLGYIFGILVVAGLIVFVVAWFYPDQTVVISSMIVLFLLVMLAKPPKLVPVLQSRMMVLALLTISSIGVGGSLIAFNAEDAELREQQATMKAEQDQQLSFLREVNPNAYIDELEALGRDDEWFAALKDFRPKEYLAEKARRDQQAQLEHAQREEEAKQERLNKHFEDAKGDGRNGINLKAVDFKGTWNLSVSEGRLHCEQGPVYNGVPRPYVLFDAGGKTYGVNGAAMGKGGYKDARTLLDGEAGQPPYDLKMLDILIKTGLGMC